MNCVRRIRVNQTPLGHFGILIVIRRRGGGATFDGIVFIVFAVDYQIRVI